MSPPRRSAAFAGEAGFDAGAEAADGGDGGDAEGEAGEDDAEAADAGAEFSAG